MIQIPTYPPAAPSLSDPNLTASRFLKNPTFVARRLQTLMDLRYVGSRLLRGRQETNGGAIGYELVEGIFADAVPEVVAPGSEYTLTTTGDGTAALAQVVKWGKDSLVTDEAIKRRNMDPVEKGLIKLANSAGLSIDTAVLSVVASGITETNGATAVWTHATDARILRDILIGVADIRKLNLGYNPDVLVVDDMSWAYMASDTVIATAMAREAQTNPVYTGRFEMIAGLEVVVVPSANLPGGVGTSAWVIDSSQLGLIATEDLGGGYTRAGELVETKVMRTEETDGWRIRARANFVPVVTDPGAGLEITGVHA